MEWCRKGVVNNKKCANIVGRAPGGRDVNYLTQRIAWCFKKNHCSVGFHIVSKSRTLVGIQPGNFYSKPFKYKRNLVMRPVYVVEQDQVVSCFQICEIDQRAGRHELD